MHCNELIIEGSEDMSYTTTITVNQEVQFEKIVVPRHTETLTLEFVNVFEEPMADANVKGVNQQTPTIEFNGITNAEGIVVFNNILFGNYDVTVTSPTPP